MNTKKLRRLSQIGSCVCLCGFGYVLGRVVAGTDSGEIFYFGGQQQKKGGISEIARSLLGYRVDTCSHKFMLKARGYCRILFSGTEHHKRT